MAWHIPPHEIAEKQGEMPHEWKTAAEFSSNSSSSVASFPVPGPTLVLPVYYTASDKSLG